MKLDSDLLKKNVIKLFASLGIETGYFELAEKDFENSKIDANASLRFFFAKNNIYNFAIKSKVSNDKLNLNLITDKGIAPSTIFLFQTSTKQVTAQFWIPNLSEFAKSGHLLVFFVLDKSFYLFNANDPRILQKSDNNNLAFVIGSPLERTLNKIQPDTDPSEIELIEKLKKIAELGFVKSLRNGATGVGMTLETLLEINANSNRAPDYRGIEIKAKRISGLNNRPTTRATLFSQVPNWENSVCKSGVDILRKYGYLDKETNRLQLYCTNNNKPNNQGLFLKIDEIAESIESIHKSELGEMKVVNWNLNNLKKQLELKHNKTFWVKAITLKKDGDEQFHYVEIEKTGSPISSNLPTLIELGIVTIDYTLSQKLNENKSRDHGYLFKIDPENFELLFPPAESIRLI